MRIRLIGGLLVASLLAPAVARATERPLVQVGFSIAEPLYRERLGNRVADVEGSILELLLRRLNTEVGFLRFTNASSVLRLKVTLGLPGADKVSSHDVNFHFTLAGTEGARPTAWLFRERGKWDDALGGPALFGLEIKSSLARSPFTALVANLFEYIAVAEEGESIELLPDYEIAWRLPYKQADLCLGTATRLRVTTEVRNRFTPPRPRDVRAEVDVYDPEGPLDHEELRHRILCLPEQDEDLAFLRNRSLADVTVKKVFVKTYARMSTGCQEPASPRLVAGSLGGRR